MPGDANDTDGPSASVLRALIDNLPEAAWLVDRDLRLVLANGPYRSLQRLMGGGPTADGEPSVRLGRTADELAAWDALYRRALAGESFSDDITFASPGGGRTMEITFQPVWEADEPSCIAVTARDVTLRKRTEEALRTAEQRLATVLEGSEVGLWEWNLVTGDLTVDRRWLAMVGWSGDDDTLTLSPEAQADVVHPGDLRRAEELLADCLDDPLSLFEAELRMRHRNGRWVHVLTRGRFTAWDEAGRPLEMSGTHLDVSEAGRAREAAALGGERLRAISDAMLDPQALLEPVYSEAGEIVDFSVLEANRMVCELVSRSREQVVGATLATLFPDAVPAGLVALCVRVADSGEPLSLDSFATGASFSAPTASTSELLGADRFYDIRASRIGGAVSLTWRDVSERHGAALRERLAAEAVAASEERFRSLYESMAQGVVFQNAEGYITAVNPAAERILGLSLDQLQGRTSTDPRWRSVQEDGRDFPGEQHPAMVALHSGCPVHGVQMGVYHPATDAMRWILIDAVPQFQAGQERPSQVYSVFTDITDLRKAEAALRESEDLFKYDFDYSAVGKVIRSPEGRITAVNDALCRMLGYTREELMGSGPDLVTLPEDLAITLNQSEAMLEGTSGESRRRRRFIAKDGSIRWGDAAFSLRRDAEGKPMYFINSIVDITEQVAAAEEIDRLIAMRDVAEQVAMTGSFSWDLNTGLSVWSPELERLHDMQGRDVGADFGVVIESCVHPEDRGRLRELFAAHRRAGDALDYEYRVVHRDGGEHILHATASMEPAQEGQKPRITGFVRDVTVERHAEEAAAVAVSRLAESEATLRAILENAAEGISLLGLQSGRYVFMSPRQVELTGFSVEEMNELPADEAIARCHPDDRARVIEQQRRLAAGEIEFAAMEYRWRVKGGEYRWFRDSRRVLRDDTGKPYALVGVSGDITARKQLEAELRESRDEYRLMLETEQAAGEEHRHIARGLHDAVAQNVFSASLLAEALPAIFERTPERALDDVVLIRRLIRAVFAELRFLLFELRPEALAVDSMETLLQRLGDALAVKADLTVDLDLDADLVLPAEVRAVFYRVAQEAFNNIARSARATRVSVVLERVDEAVRLAIRDDGKGFDPAACRSGMGIASMRERAQSIGAQLAIESEPGAGTSVTLSWRGRDGREGEG